MAKINPHLFQAAGTIYQALLGQDSNRMPEHPEHAYRAHQIAHMLHDACGQDAVITNVAARLLCGYMANDKSAHCTNQEFVAWAAQAVRHLIGAFVPPAPQPPQPFPYATPASPPVVSYMPPQPHLAGPSGVPQMPPQPVGPQYPPAGMVVEAPPPMPPAPPIVPAVPSLDVPDFT